MSKKKRYSSPGSSPALLTPFPPGEAVESILTLIEYHPGGVRERRIASIKELPEAGDDCVRWIDMGGLKDIEMLKALGGKYGLHPLALEDVIHTGQRPKVEAYDQHLFIVGQMIYNDQANQLCTEQVSIFLCPNLLITIQEEPLMDVFDPVRERIRGGRGFIRKLKADYLAYALLDAMIDHCFPVMEKLGDALDELEGELLENPNRESVQKLYEHRRKLMIFRRIVWPERDVISTLLHEEGGMISPQTKIYLRDCYDHAVQIMDFIENYRDVTASLLEMYLSSVSMRTNDIMRVLTVISSIFIPLTFVAGVYGMNFDYADGKMPLNMPELHQPGGYMGCLGMMALIVTAQVIYFRRKKWL
ncbi:MAG: magnesium/cobalt transporter CorA [Verrucomicrobiota bacterium]